VIDSDEVIDYFHTLFLSGIYTGFPDILGRM